MLANRQDRSNRRRRSRGFTLVEMLVVVAIIGILAGTVAWRVLGSLSSAKIKAAGTHASSVASALQAFLLDGGLMEDGMDLEVLLLPPTESNLPGSPYLQNAKNLTDPWGSVFYVKMPGVENYDFDVISPGPDKQVGTEDDITH